MAKFKRKFLETAKKSGNFATNENIVLSIFFSMWFWQLQHWLNLSFHKKKQLFFHHLEKIYMKEFFLNYLLHKIFVLSFFFLFWQSRTHYQHAESQNSQSHCKRAFSTVKCIHTSRSPWIWSIVWLTEFKRTEKNSKREKKKMWCKTIIVSCYFQVLWCAPKKRKNVM